MKKAKNNMMSVILFLMFMLTLTVVIVPVMVYAQVDEEEVKKEEQQNPAVEIKEIREKEVRYPNKLTPKEPANDSDNDKNTNKGIPTTNSNAKAILTESVDNSNNEYPIHHSGDNFEKDKYSADARQFISFKTKNGKTFHLIINHDEKGENVMLLTEVSEDDLLNITEIEKPKEIQKEEPVEEVKKEEAKPVEKEEKSGMGMYLFIVLLVTGVIIAGYYFKVYKKKQEENDEDDEVYDEFEDDEMETVDLEQAESEMENTQYMEEAAIDAYEDEEE